MHYLTNGREKYIYFPASGREQFFDLSSDRQELHDLAGQASCAERVGLWRKRLIELLGERGDGFSDGHKLLLRTDRWPPEVQPQLEG